jgi:CRISPR-associated exonuclease Cas4
MIEEYSIKQFSQDDLIPISSIADLVFCERRAALHFIEGIWEENRFTAEGHILHDKVHEADCEMRKDIRIVRGLRMRSFRLGLSGVADVVEFRRMDISQSMDKSVGDTLLGVVLPGVEGLWKPFPVEYKRGKIKHEKSYEVQLCAQAICLEEMLNVQISEGALFYGKSLRRNGVDFTKKLRFETGTAAKRMHELIVSTRTPPPVYTKKCDSCSLVSECLPKTMGKKRSVKSYLKRILDESERWVV